MLINVSNDSIQEHLPSNEHALFLSLCGADRWPEYLVRHDQPRQ